MAKQFLNKLFNGFVVTKLLGPRTHFLESLFKMGKTFFFASVEGKKRERKFVYTVSAA